MKRVAIGTIFIHLSTKRTFVFRIESCSRLPCNIFTFCRVFSPDIRDVK